MSRRISNSRRLAPAISSDSKQGIIAKLLGQSAVSAAKNGFYINRTGEKVYWRQLVETTCASKRSIPPEERLPDGKSRVFSETRAQVTNDTTIGAARRLTEAGHRPLALNFANGIHPGGGFLGGAKAQEEVLCRSSALYQTLVDDRMYEAHRKRLRPDSTDWAIYSPDVPVFRKDDGRELDRPWLLSFITCAHPSLPGSASPNPAICYRGGFTAFSRSPSFRLFGTRPWSMGLWRLRQRPRRTAMDFRRALKNDFRGAFSDIVFAITDWSPERRFLGPFRDGFS
ncbi:MAG TPA: TIGR02452 family protein [Candidatus Binatia bacterium]|nr:TIGR02452 family protein [Candidatus Binatia bacterium]